jgi:hypothetical protein
MGSSDIAGNMQETSHTGRNMHEDLGYNREHAWGHRIQHGPCMGTSDIAGNMHGDISYSGEHAGDIGYSREQA